MILTSSIQQNNDFFFLKHANCIPYLGLIKTSVVEATLKLYLAKQATVVIWSSLTTVKLMFYKSSYLHLQDRNKKYLTDLPVFTVYLTVLQMIYI